MIRLVLVRVFLFLLTVLANLLCGSEHYLFICLFCFILTLTEKLFLKCLSEIVSYFFFFLLLSLFQIPHMGWDGTLQCPWQCCRDSCLMPLTYFKILSWLFFFTWSQMVLHFLHPLRAMSLAFTFALIKTDKSGLDKNDKKNR